MLLFLTSIAIEKSFPERSDGPKQEELSCKRHFASTFVTRSLRCLLPVRLLKLSPTRIRSDLPWIIGKMMGKSLGWGPLNNQPPVHLIWLGIYWVYPLLKGSILTMIGMTTWNFLVATAVDGKFIVTFCIEAQVDGTNLWNQMYLLTQS